MSSLPRIPCCLLGFLGLLTTCASPGTETSSGDLDTVDASITGFVSTASEQPLPAPGVGKSPEVSAGACPAEMVLVEGNACPNAEQPCTQWIDDPVKFPYARCAEFARPSTCKGDRVAMKFCIDKLEAAGADGLPIADISWTNAAASCKIQGKRLCQEREWLFACEGEEMVPYPYGYTRDASACNFEKDNLVEKGQMVDMRQPVSSNPKCLSPFGVQNMVGNIDEWVVLDRPHWRGGHKMMSGLKGGWWGPLRNRCRPVTVDHDEYFHELQTGFRCCADAK